MGIAVLDKSLVFKWSNRVYRELLDEPYRSRPLEGVSLYEAMPESQQLAGIFLGVAETGQPYASAEYRYDGFARGTTYWRWSLTRLTTGDLLLSCAEITEQVRARQAVERLATESECVLQAIPQIVWTAKPNGSIEYFNNRWYSYTGQQGREALGWGWGPAVHPDDLPKVLGLWSDAVSQGSRYEQEFRLRRAGDGAYRWHLGRAVPIRDKEGVITRWFGTCTDVHDQKVVSEHLRESQERLRIALTASETGTFRWDPRTGHFLEFDDNLKQLFGVPPNKSVRRMEDFIQRLHPDDLPFLFPAIARRRNGHDIELEYRVVLPDGGIRWLYDRGKMEFDAAGRPAYLVGACTDITRRKQTEEALRESEARFRRLADAMPQLVWTGNERGEVEYFNQRWYCYTGQPEENAEGQGWREVLHPEDLLRAVERWRHSVNTGEPYEIEYRLRRHDGQYRWFLGRAYAVRDERGRVRRWFGTSTDVHDRKLAEDALRKSEKLAAAGRLAASIAHEINNPLEAVTNLLYLALHEKTVTPEVREYLLLADQELRRVSNIARQTLGFYRESASPITYSVCDDIEDVLLFHARKIAAKHLSVEKRFRFKGQVRALRGEIRQVLANLISNALDASSKHGKLVVHVARAPRWGENPRAGVRITVGDTGTGIAAENLAKVFEPFFTTKKDVGTGLGLWVSREIVEKHGGRIRVRSSTRPGHSGTVMSLFLPDEAIPALVEQESASAA